MQIRRVALLYRKSFYQLFLQERREEPLLRAVAAGDPVALGFEASHHTNQTSMQEAMRLLESRGIEVVVRGWRRLRSTRNFDLVISLGGDGTLMATAWYVQNKTPVLGINSDPNKSVGALCAGSVRDLAGLLDALGDDRLRPRPHNRLRVRVEGDEVLHPVLNDVLFAHKVPAGLSRFDLAVVPADMATEVSTTSDGVAFTRHRGSGIWISTAVGSTAAIRSAGGRVMRPLSRRLQYLVREPFFHPVSGRPTRIRAELEPGKALVLVSRQRKARVWGDGVEHSHTVHFGQRVVVDNHPAPLYLVHPER